MDLTNEERILKLEEAVFGDHIELSQDTGKWSLRQSEISWERLGLLEDWAKVYIEKPRNINGNKPRVVCQMNRGIWLYAKDIPIYKDVIRKMESVQRLLERGQVPISEVVPLDREEDIIN